MTDLKNLDYELIASEVVGTRDIAYLTYALENLGVDPQIQYDEEFRNLLGAFTFSCECCGFFVSADERNWSQDGEEFCDNCIENEDSYCEE